MKKHLIAAAVAAAVAVPAMAQVTISGNLDTGYASFKNEVTTAGVTVSDKFTRIGNANAMSTSTLAFSGTEDLGGGLKANFFVNQALNTSTGAFTARDAWASVGGGFGTIKIGRFTPAGEAVSSRFAVSGSVNTVGSVDFIYGGNAFGGTPTRRGNDAFTASGFATGLTDLGRDAPLVEWTSSNLSGFVATVGLSQSTGDLSTAAGENKRRQLDLALTYSAGPLAVGVTMTDNDRNGTAAAESANKDESKMNSIGASYDLGVAVLRASYITRKDELAGVQDSKIKLATVGATIPLGATSLFASYSDGSDKGNGTPAEDADLSGFQVGAVYSMSKRTNLYAIYGSQDIDVTAGDAKLSGFAIGIRHSF
jgi:predicted porin